MHFKYKCIRTLERMKKESILTLMKKKLGPSSNLCFTTERSGHKEEGVLQGEERSFLEIT